MDNGWQKYKRRNAHLPANLVSIARSGDLMFGSGFYERLGQPRGVVLYFNPQRNAIGICPAGDDEADRFLVSKAGRLPTSGRRINTTKFLNYYGIPHEVNARYPARIEQNGSGPMLVIELAEEKAAR